MKRLRSVMLVDDNPFDNEIHRLALLRAKAVAGERHILVATGGAQALAMLEEARIAGSPHHPPQLVMIDINMPGMNGFEFAEKLRAWLDLHGLESVVLMMLSSSARKDDQERARQLGLHGYVQKPLTKSRAAELANTYGEPAEA